MHFCNRAPLLGPAPPWSPSSRTAYSYNPDAQLYGQGSGGAYFDSQAGGAQVTTVVSSASSGMAPHSMVGITMDVGGSQIISGGSTYLIHGAGMDGNRYHASQSSRSSSAMVSQAPPPLSLNALQNPPISTRM